MQENAETTNETPKNPETNALERRLELSVPVTDIDKDVDARLKKLARTVKMDGFRPGKVPMRIVASQYGPQARSEAIGDLVHKLFGETVREQNLRVAGYPRYEPGTTEKDDHMTFSAVFEVYPEFQPADVSSAEIEKPVLEVTEAEVDKTLNVLREQQKTFAETDRAAAKDDRVFLDFIGKLDGEAFEGGTANDFPFVLGEGRMLPEFEAAAEGLKAGESKDFDLTFPEDYGAENLKGKTTQFSITVKKVEAPVLPEVDAEFAKRMGVEDGDVAKLRSEIESNLRREVARRVAAKTKEQAMAALVELNPIEIPRVMVDAEVQRLVEEARENFAQRGMKDLPIKPEWFEDQAQRRVRLGLVIAEVVKSEALMAKPDQLRAKIEDVAQTYEKPEEVINWYYSQPQRLAEVEALVIEDNVVEWLLSKAKVTDKAVAFDELMGQQQAA